MSIEDSIERFLLDRFGFVLFAVSFTVIVLLLADLPRQSTETSIGEVVVTVLTALTLVLALLASGISRPVIRISVLIAAAFVIWGLVSLVAGVKDVTWLRIIWFLLVVMTPFIVLRRLVNHTEVTAETLLGAAAVYLLIAVMFTFLYLLLDGLDPGQFFGSTEPTTSFMYFSLVTITTLGYGDLQPHTELARTLSVATAIIGQIYLVLIVARLVGLYTASRTRGAPFEPPPRIDRDQG